MSRRSRLVLVLCAAGTAALTGCTGTGAVNTDDDPTLTQIESSRPPAAASSSGAAEPSSAKALTTLIARNLVAYRAANGNRWPRPNSPAFDTVVTDQILNGATVRYVVNGQSMTFCVQRTDGSWAEYDAPPGRITDSGATGGCPS